MEQLPIPTHDEPTVDVTSQSFEYKKKFFDSIGGPDNSHITVEPCPKQVCNITHKAVEPCPKQVCKNVLKPRPVVPPKPRNLSVKNKFVADNLNGVNENVKEVIEDKSMDKSHYVNHDVVDSDSLNTTAEIHNNSNETSVHDHVEPFETVEAEEEEDKDDGSEVFGEEEDYDDWATDEFSDESDDSEGENIADKRKSRIIFDEHDGIPDLVSDS